MSHDPSAVAYRTPLGAGSEELRERGSRFLAWVDPAASEVGVRRRLKELQATYRDATHVCYAWRLGWPPSERAHDAGEPAGTAGMPILQVLRGAEISDVLAVVARWFGGTKLGKGGLARAYAGATRAALGAVDLDERILARRLRVEVDYGSAGAIKRLIHRPGVDLIDAEYGELVAMELEVQEHRIAALMDDLAALGARWTTAR